MEHTLQTYDIGKKNCQASTHIVCSQYKLIKAYTMGDWGRSQIPRPQSAM